MSKAYATLTIEISLECNCDFRSLTRNKTLMTKFSDFMQKIVNPVMNVMSSVAAPVASIKPDVSLQHIVPSKWMSSKYQGCTWIFYRPEDIISYDTIFIRSPEGIILDHKLLENDTIVINGSGRIYPSGMFKILDMVIVACQEIYEGKSTNFVTGDKIVFYLMGFYEIVKPTTPLEDCIWTIYEPTDIEYYDHIFILDEFGSIMDFNLSDNDSLTVNSSGESYQPGWFMIRDNGILICESYVITVVVIPLDKTLLATVTVIIFFFVVYSAVFSPCIFVPKYRPRVGRLQFQLMIVTLVTFFPLIILFLKFEIPVVRVTAAIILTHGILAAFIWLNIMIMDTWLESRPSAPDEERPLVVHYLCGWGIPLFLICLYITLHFTEVDSIFGPEFDTYRCWYKDNRAVMIYIGIPTAYPFSSIFS